MAKKSPALRRLDAELVKRKIARSREHAQEMIKAGRVTVNGMAATKPATGVDGNMSIKVAESEDDRWASRGAHKLLGALEELPQHALVRARVQRLVVRAARGDARAAEPVQRRAGQVERPVQREEVRALVVEEDVTFVPGGRGAEGEAMDTS